MKKYYYLFTDVRANLEKKGLARCNDLLCVVTDEILKNEIFAYCVPDDCGIAHFFNKNNGTVGSISINDIEPCHIKEI